MAQNLLHGALRESIEARLRAEGVRRPEAHVDALLASPTFLEAATFARHMRRLQLVLRLAKTADLAAGTDTIERVSGLRAEAFFNRYYATNTPVVITDLVPRWRAFGRWSPAFLRETFGDVLVDVAVGRNADPDYDLHTAKLSRSMRLAEYVDLVESGGDTNDHYAVAQNRNSDRPDLQRLFDDVVLDPAWLDPSRLRGSTALWLGPGGTVTPLHHDTSNIAFATLYGTKRFTLAAPWEESLLHTTRGVYNRVDPERVDPHLAPGLDRVRWRRVDLAPGELLFLPVGWWHHVRALTVSLNLAFTNLARPNGFDWFRPGEVR